jgi:hypothetical protein
MLIDQCLWLLIGASAGVCLEPKFDSHRLNREPVVDAMSGQFSPSVEIPETGIAPPVTLVPG